MPSFLPPVVMELRAEGTQAIREMAKVGESAKAMADRAVAESRREAAAAREAAAQTRAAAEERTAAVDAAAKAQSEAAAKTAAARKAASEEEQRAIANTNRALAEGSMTAKEAAAQQAAAMERASAQITAAEAREAEAAKRTATMQQEAAAAVKAAKDAEAKAMAASSAQFDAMTAKHSTNAKAMVDASNIISAAAIVTSGVIGVEAINLAAKFERATTLLVTAGGESKAALGQVRDGIKSIAVDTGTSTEQLADGMYMVEKAGYRGADGLKVLRAAAEGAKAENVDLATMTEALTSLMLDYGIGANKSVTMTNELVAASGLAKSTMQEFAAAMSTVVPVAAVSRLSFEQVGGALATMTQHGMSAQQSAQNLGHLLTQLQKPSLIATKAMQQIGIDVNDLSQHIGDENGGRGLLASLRLIDQQIQQNMGKDGLVVQDTMMKSKSAVDDLNIMIAKMPPELAKLSRGFLDGSVSQKEYMKGYKDMGGSASALGGQFMALSKSVLGVNDLVKSGRPELQTYVAEWNRVTGTMVGARTAFMLLLGDGGMLDGKKFEENIKAIGEAAKQTGQHISTWADTQHNFSTQLDMTKQSAEVLGIELGEKLLPVARNLLGGVSDLMHGFEQGNPVLLTFTGILATLAGGAVLVSTIAKIVELGKSARSMAGDVRDSAGRFTSGFKGIEDAAERGTSGMTRFGGAVKGALPTLGRMTTALGVASAAIAGMKAIDSTSIKDATPSLDAMKNALIGAATSGKDFNGVFSQWDSGVLTRAPSDVHNLSDAVGYLSDGWAQAGHNTAGFVGHLFGIKDGTDQVIDRFHSMGDALGQMAAGGSLSMASTGFGQLAAEFTKSGKSAQDALDVVPGYSDALTKLANDSGVTLSKQELLEFALGKIPDKMQKVASSALGMKDAQQEASDTKLKKALDDIGVSAEGVVTDMEKLRKSMEDAGLVQVTAMEAEARHQKSLMDVKAEVQKLIEANGGLGAGLNATRSGFDLTTETGQTLQEKFLAVREAGLKVAESVKGDGVDAQAKFRDAMANTYNELVGSANQMGITGDKADALARSVMGIPPGVSISTWMDDYARNKAAETKAAVDAIPTDKTVELTLHYTETGDKPGNSTGIVHANAAGGFQAFAGGGAVGGYPRGGLLSGPGTGISDSMLARVSNGEFIIRAAMVQKYGLDTFTAFNNGAIDAAPGSSSAQGAWNGRTNGGGTSVTVYAQTNATGPQIASEVGWAIRNQN